MNWLKFGALLLALPWFACAALGQTGKTYHFPIPGSESLTGTFGELRGAHFHAGLDIKTFGAINIDVQAADEGYVFRASVSHSGYGKAIYVRHPDGNYTVYGHLESFMPEVEERVYQQQITKKQFNQEVYFKPNEIPVKRGQNIAKSGNTGASGGPHLHFEVRDSLDRTLNPLHYFIQNIPDEQPPYISQVAFQPLTAEARVFGRFEKKSIWPNREEQKYYSTDIIDVYGPVGFEFSGQDRLAGSSNKNGCYSAELYIDDQLIYEYKMNCLRPGDGRYIKAHGDYEYKLAKGVWLQKCYVENGNELGVYTHLKNKGYIDLKDDRPHQLRFELKDLHNNKATYTATLQNKGARGNLNHRPAPNALTAMPNYWVDQNVLVIKSGLLKKDETVTLQFADNSSQTLQPAYSSGNFTYILATLQPPKLPVAALCESWPEALRLKFSDIIAPGKETVFEPTEDFRAVFAARSLFDTLFLEFDRKPAAKPHICSDVFHLGYNDLPLYEPISVTMKQNENARNYLPRQIIPAHVSAEGYYSRLETDGSGAAQARELGAFCWVADTKAPQFSPNKFGDGAVFTRGRERITFDLSDDLSGIDPYQINVRIDGQWIPAEYYSPRGVMYVKFYKPLAPGAHTLSVSMVDYAGNAAFRSYAFTAQ